MYEISIMEEQKLYEESEEELPEHVTKNDFVNLEQAGSLKRQDE